MQILFPSAPSQPHAQTTADASADAAHLRASPQAASPIWDAINPRRLAPETRQDASPRQMIPSPPSPDLTAAVQRPRGMTFGHAVRRFADVTGLTGLVEAAQQAEVRREAQGMLDRLTRQTVDTFLQTGSSPELEARFAGLGVTWQQHYDHGAGLPEYRRQGHALVGWAASCQCIGLLQRLLPLYDTRPDPSAPTDALRSVALLLRDPFWETVRPHLEASCQALAQLSEHLRNGDRARVLEARRISRRNEVDLRLRALTTEPSLSDDTSDWAALAHALQAMGADGLAVGGSCRADGRVAIVLGLSDVEALLTACSDQALRTLLRYRMPAFALWPTLFDVMVSRGAVAEANRFFIICADVLREHGLGVDAVRLDVPEEIAAAGLSTEARSRARDAASPADARTDGASDVIADDWSTVSSQTTGPSQSEAVVLLGAIDARGPWLTLNHHVAVQTSTHKPSSVPLRVLAQGLGLTEAVAYLRTDGQKPAAVGLARYEAPLIDLT